MQKKSPLQSSTIIKKSYQNRGEIMPWDKKIYAIMHKDMLSFFRLLTKSLMCDLVVA